MNANADPRVDALLEQAVADHLAGQTPDIEALALAHPALADEIRQRWQDLQQLQDPLGPLLQLDPAPSAIEPGTWIGNFRLFALKAILHNCRETHLRTA